MQNAAVHPAGCFVSVLMVILIKSRLLTWLWMQQTTCMSAAYKTCSFLDVSNNMWCAHDTEATHPFRCAATPSTLTSIFEEHVDQPDRICHTVHAG